MGSYISRIREGGFSEIGWIVPAIVGACILLLVIYYMKKESYVGGVIGASGGKTLVLCHSTTCPHCVEMYPKWKEAMSQVGNRVAVVELLSGQDDIPDDVSLLPTIRMYSQYPSGDFIEYNGDRSAQDILKFVVENS